MDVAQHLKQATALAKSGDHDSAIEVLLRALPFMVSSGGHPNASFTKIIPYFQKAGRYDEGVRFALDELVLFMTENQKKTFAHKVPEISEAFNKLAKSDVYHSLAIIAKREGRLEQHQQFLELEASFFNEYKQMLELAQELQLRKDYQEYKQISRRPPQEWTSTNQKKFQSLIEEEAKTTEKDEGRIRKTFARIFKRCEKH